MMAPPEKANAPAADRGAADQKDNGIAIYSGSIPTRQAFVAQSYADTWNLCCPRCGGDYLHHDGVEVYERREDAEHVNLTVVRGKSTMADYLPNARSGNPSARRHGLRIRFFCEECGDGLTLNVAQHKGLTLLDWAVRPPSGAWRTWSEGAI